MSEFPIYPNGTTIRNLIYNSLQRQQHIMSLIKDTDEVPAWVLMLVSRASSDMNAVEEFINYYYQPQQAMAGWSASENMREMSLDHFKKMYHSGQMVRSLLYNAHFRQTGILSKIKDDMQVPPWVIFLVSRATNDFNCVSDYLSYEIARHTRKI